MASYYIANDGNDANDGLTISTPWQNKTKLEVDNFFSGGDIIHFKAGDTWIGPPVVFRSSGSSGNPIIIRKYGVGADPIISVLATASGWINTSGDIWEYQNASFPEKLLIVTFDGEFRHKGRLPKTGFYNVDAATANTSINSDDVDSGVIDFTGAEMVIRKNQFIDHVITIDNHTGDLLEYGSDLSTLNYPPSVGYGFFLQNKMECLTELGDWYHDPATDKLYMCFVGSAPGSHVVKASIGEDCFIIDTESYITIEDLDFVGANKRGIRFDTASHLTFSGIGVDLSGNYSIGTEEVGSSNIIIQNSYLQRANGNNIFVYYTNDNITVNNNRIDDTYLHRGSAGIFGNSDVRGIPIAIPGSDNVSITNNEINDCGFNAIDAVGENLVIDSNTIYRSHKLKGDGGAIYGYTGSPPIPITIKIEITNNKIFDVDGNNDGTPAEATIRGIFQTYGIYTDDGYNNALISGNVVSGGKGAAYYGHNCQNIEIADNDFIGNALCVKWAQDSTDEIRSINYHDNRHYLTGAHQRIVNAFSNANDMDEWGTFVDNEYYYLNDNIPLFEANYGQPLPSNFGVTMAEWAALVGEITYFIEAFGQVVPDTYTPVLLIGEKTYASSGEITDGEFGAFPFVDGGTATWSVGKVLLEKTVAGIKLAYVNLDHNVDVDEAYVLTVSLSSPTSGEKVALNFEHSWGSAYSYPNSKVIWLQSDEQEYKLYFTNKETWALEKLVFLMEEGFTECLIDTLKFEVVDFEIESDIKIYHNNTDTAQEIDLGEPYTDEESGLTISILELEPNDHAIVRRVGPFVPETPSLDPSRRIKLYMIEDFQSMALTFSEDILFQDNITVEGVATFEAPPKSEINASEDDDLVNFSQIKENASLDVLYGLSKDAADGNGLRLGDFVFDNTLYVRGSTIPYQVFGYLFQSVAEENVNLIHTLDKGTVSDNIEGTFRIVNFTTGEYVGWSMHKEFDDEEYAMALAKNVTAGFQSVELAVSNLMIILDGINEKGFENLGEYEANFTSLSLATVRYARDFRLPSEQTFTYVALDPQTFTLTNEPIVNSPIYVWLNDGVTKIKLPRADFFMTGLVLTITDPVLVGGDIIEVAYEYENDFV